MKDERSEEGETGDSRAVHLQPKKKHDLLRELTSTLAIRAERIRLQQRYEHELGRSRPVNNPSGPQGDHQPVIERAAGDVNIQQAPRPLPIPGSHIPVSHARLRRRQQQRNTNSNKTSVRHNDIAKYRPDYTWNRGGRVKELRIRNLARKYLFLWLRRVFGRVRLSAAQKHYECVLLHKTFEEWHTYWWELRQEWRLMVRAECHYRYVMWLRVFGAWKDFIILRTVQKAKVDRAVTHYGVRVCRKVLHAWLVYWQEEKRKAVQRQKADRLFADVSLRRWWQCWRGMMERRDAMAQMENVSLQFWAYRIQAQHWLAWRSAFEWRQREKARMQFAANHCITAMTKRCLKAWLTYWRSRRTKKHLAGYAGQVYSVSVQAQAFQWWVRRWRERRAMHQHQSQIQELALRFQTRRFFCHWRHYIEIIHNEKAQVVRAEQHYCRHVLSLGLNAFRLSVVQHRIKIMRQAIADQLHQRQVERWVFGVWLDRLEKREEQQLADKTQKARGHCQRVLLRQTFDQLKMYKNWRHHRKAQYVKADTHHYLRTAPHCLFRMRVFVQLMKNHRNNKQKALEYRRENLLLGAFGTWKQAFTHSKDVRLMKRMAILHRDEVLVHSYFQRWKAAFNLTLQDQAKESDAEGHYRTSLCRSHLLAWRDYVGELRKGEADEVKAVRHHYRSTLKHVWTDWRQFVERQRRKHMLQTRADRHHHHKECRRMWTAWRAYILQVREVKAKAEVKYQGQCTELLRWSLLTWRENSNTQAADRQCEQAAGVHFHRQLLAKVLQTWHRFAAIHAYKKSQTRHMVTDAREHLRLCTLRIYLHSWRRARDAAIVEHLKKERASVHYDHNLMSAVLQQWTAYTATAIRKRLLVRQSTWFLSVQLTAKFFLMWRRNHAASVEERGKSGLALWHWSLVLQKKVLRAWFLYREERQRKRQRLAEAMENRRQRLLREGASQWLRVAGALAEMRSRMAAQQQVKSASALFQHVHRCAIHWKVWAAKRVLLRQQNRPPPQSVKQAPATMLWSVPMRRTPTGDTALPVPQMQFPAPPKMAAASPTRLLMISTGDTRQGQVAHGMGAQPGKVRAKPRRPAFLVESLQRAGLLAHSQDFLGEQGLYSPSTTDMDDGHEGQPHPDSGHYGVRTVTGAPGIRSGNKPTLDFSLSAEVKTGSDSTLEGQGFVRPLRFSNSADTDSTTHGPGTTTSSSHHFITPTSQRSQPPGNPLLQSSPISLHGLVDPEPPSRSHQAMVSDRDKVLGDGFRSSDGEIIGGNLTGRTQDDTPPATFPSPQVLMKPEDFLRRRDGTEFPQDSHRDGERETQPSSAHAAGKTYMAVTTPRLHTPRMMMPRSPRKGGNLARDADGLKPPGILLVKGGDSDADVSPLNTARSRGTVTFASPKTPTPAQELKEIRDRLRYFKEQKKKLRRLERQEGQLSSWLQEQDATDTDATQVTQELASMQDEIAELRLLVSSQRLSCEKLVARAKVMAEQLGTNL